MKAHTCFLSVLAFIVVVFPASSSSRPLPVARPAGKNDRGKSIQQKDGGGSSSRDRSTFFRDYFYEVTSLSTIGEPCIFSKKDEEQRKEFNNLTDEIFLLAREGPKPSKEENKAFWRKLKALWKQRSVLISSASKLLKEEIENLARDGECGIWEKQKPPKQFYGDLMPRKVSIPPQCTEVWKSEPSSSSHH